MKTGVFSYNHGTIRYFMAGSGDPIVFIHGFSLDHRMWQSQVAYFKQTHTVITYDARGFGTSSIPTHPYAHHFDLAALLNHLRIQNAHLVGLSMGGRIAINFTLMYPQKVRTLSLLDTTVDGYSAPPAWQNDARTLGLDTVKQNWLSLELFKSAAAQPNVSRALQRMVGDYSGWHWLNQDLRTPQETDALARLNKITVPTLIMVGEKDDSYILGITHTLAKKIPHAQQVIIADAGHMVNMEQPDITNTLLSNFITKNNYRS